MPMTASEVRAGILVKVLKPTPSSRHRGFSWIPEMDKFDGKVANVTSVHIPADDRGFTKVKLDFLTVAGGVSYAFSPGWLVPTTDVAYENGDALTRLRGV